MSYFGYANVLYQGAKTLSRVLLPLPALKQNNVTGGLLGWSANAAASALPGSRLFIVHLPHAWDDESSLLELLGVLKRRLVPILKYKKDNKVRVRFGCGPRPYPVGNKDGVFYVLVRSQCVGLMKGPGNNHSFYWHPEDKEQMDLVHKALMNAIQERLQFFPDADHTDSITLEVYTEKGFTPIDP